MGAFLFNQFRNSAKKETILMISKFYKELRIKNI